MFHSKVLELGNFIANTGDRLIDVDFSGNQSTVTVPIDLTNDDVAEVDGVCEISSGR